MKRIFPLIILLHLFFTNPAQAAKEFTTEYRVTMEAANSGVMQVTQEISLTNKLSNLYAKAYTLTLEKNQIKNVSAYDAKGPLRVEVENKDNKTLINLEFNDEVVGQGKTLNFTLTYVTEDMLTRSGQVWELLIPRLGSADEIDSYSLLLKIPKSFGEPAYFSPNYKNSTIENGYRLFTFEKNHLINTGVTAAFGEFQVYDFNLTYDLFNKENSRVKQIIALPPDTNYQRVKYFSLDPKPLDVNPDDDGNWLAEYLLKPKENLQIKARGQVKIFANPAFNYSQNRSDLSNLLVERDFWPVNNAQIKELALKLKTPQAIYNYVAEKLTYDYSRARIGAERLGALEILNNPDRAICMEFTDLFVALARAAGIPARELNGYAYTDNPRLKPLSFAQDVLHAWSEYWDKDKKLWIQVDPTWQNTSGGIDYFSKLDQSHFVFAIHGLDSRFPLPAGAYKSVGGEAKNVNVVFGKPIDDKVYLPEIDFQIPTNLISEFSNQGGVVLRNISSEAFYNLSYLIESENLQITAESSVSLETLLPFSQKEIKYRLKPKKNFFHGSDKITVYLNGATKEYNLSIKSLVLSYLLPIVGGMIGFIAITLIALKTRSLYLQRRSK